MKMPPVEKIPEAYTAIIDGRVTVYDNYATCKSSNLDKEYLIKWKYNTYYSNDNSTYWQGYVGYPVIAVLMLQGKISLNRDILKYFAKVNWNKLNKDNKRDYKKSLEQVIDNVCEVDKKNILSEIDKVYSEIQNLNIVLTRKKEL